MTQTKLPPHENQNWILMAKALRGELTEDEEIEFSAWLNEDESHTQQWTEALEVWDEVGHEQNVNFQLDTELAWTKLCAKLEFPTQAKVIPLEPYASVASEEPSVTHNNQPFHWNNLFKYAAALVLIAGLAWLGYLQFNTSVSAWTQVATTSGQKQLIYLPDSSQVTINENSTLRYEPTFSGAERQVELLGEGFFEVRKNPNKPFLVKSGTGQTKVLGTSFNVKASLDGTEVSVAVATGKVVFSSLKDQQQIILTPGYTGHLSTNGKLDKTETSKTTVSAWRALQFENTSIKEVALQLEQYFGITVKVPNQKLQKCTFTGTFDNPELKEILSVLIASSDLKVRRSENDTYSFEGVGCE